MDVKFSNTPPAPRRTLPRVGWSVGKTVHTVKTPISDTYDFLYVFYVLLRLMFAENLIIPLENCWVLRFPPNDSDYRFGQLLALDVCDLFVSNFVSRGRRYGQEGGSWRWFSLSFNVITNGTKLKNITPNVLSSPYAIVFDFVVFEKAKSRELFIFLVIRRSTTPMHLDGQPSREPNTKTSILSTLAFQLASLHSSRRAKFAHTNISRHTDTASSVK